MQRKRQTIAVRNEKDGKVYVFSKGADEVIFERLQDASLPTPAT